MGMTPGEVLVIIDEVLAQPRDRRYVHFTVPSIHGIRGTGTGEVGRYRYDARALRKIRRVILKAARDDLRAARRQSGS